MPNLGWMGMPEGFPVRHLDSYVVLALDKPTALERIMEREAKRREAKRKNS
jgi:hypothetical protein